MTSLPEVQGRVWLESRDGWRTQSLIVDAVHGHVAVGLSKVDLRADAREDALSLWGLADGKLLRTLPSYQDGVDAIAFSPRDGSLLVAGLSEGKGKLGLWPVDGGEALREMQGFPDLSALQTISFSHDGRLLLLGGGQTRQHALLVLYDMEKSEVTHRFDKLDAAVVQAAFSYDDSVVLARLRTSSQIGKGEGALEQAFRVWNVESNVRLLAFGRRPLPCRVNAFSFLTEGTVAAMAMEGLAPIDGKNQLAGWIELWDVARNKQVLSLERPHQDFFVRDLAVSADGRWMLTASGKAGKDPRADDCCVRLWDLHACKVIREMFGHNKPVTHVAFLGADGLISADAGGEVRVWPAPALEGTPSEIQP